MAETFEMKIIARIRTDFPTKFGIPRQSGLSSLTSRIVFEPEFRVREAVRGLEEFSHLWLLWQFSECAKNEWTPTVRPPKLGGNVRKGVFATRSPFRPNSVGLSSVKLVGVEFTDNGPEIIVSGADLKDGTPIFDIKPYVPYSDCHEDAKGGFSVDGTHALDVIFPDELLALIPVDKRDGVKDILAQDPRPAYHDDPERVYVMPFLDLEIAFSVNENTLTVKKITRV